MFGFDVTLWGLVTFAGGVALGGVFFGGLWLTTRNLTMSVAAPLLVVLSFLARTAIVLFGMFWLTSGDWRYILFCLAGFLVARSIILRRVFPSQEGTLISQRNSKHDHVTG